MEASEMAKQYFATSGGALDRVDVEFDTDDPVEVCLVKHRDNFGRLLCYVHKGDENYNLKLTREGWSPYFVKYGRSRLIDAQFMAAEAEAQAKRSVVWDPDRTVGKARPLRPRPLRRLLLRGGRYRRRRSCRHRGAGARGQSSAPPGCRRDPRWMGARGVR
jgi:hypothetical protein